MLNKDGHTITWIILLYLMLYILYVSEHPELSYYADGNLVSKFTEVENLKTGTLNCTVLAHPMVEVTLIELLDLID